VKELAGQHGRILVTVPIGHNAALDEAIGSGRVSLPTQTVLTRADSKNRWAETSIAQGIKSRYGTPYRNANAVYVGLRN
jgi:hypothetical protein